MHTAPPGWRKDVELTISEIARAARHKGLAFVILTPHLWESTWRVPERRDRWQSEWTSMAARARAQRGVTLIPGVEWGIDGIGHFGVSGIPLDTLDGDDFLAAAHDAGAFVVVNHPFVVPTRKPGIRVSFRNMSYRPWTTRPDPTRHDPIDGVEVWNVLHRRSHLVSERGESRGFDAADRLVRTDHRAIAVVGGTDNHKQDIRITTWVLATDASEPAVLDALRRGATCVGGLEGSTLEAHGDLDPPDRWVPIGDSAHAASRLELRWKGRARVFVDSVDLGLHDGTFTDDHAAGLHTYRIERAHSRCGFVYANL
jgi:hypothetical protein